VKPSIDNSTPEYFMRNLIKRKVIKIQDKFKSQLSRRIQRLQNPNKTVGDNVEFMHNLQRDNMKLLERILHAKQERKDTRFKSVSPNTSLNYTNRKNEFERINRENNR